MNRLELMGKRVVVTKQFVRKQERNGRGMRKRWIVEPRKERVGWIIGFRTIYDGTRKYEPEWGYYWEQESHHECAQVVFWPTQNPKYIPLDGFRIAGDDDRPIPGYWDRDSLESLRDEMIGWPRDERGRWIAWSEATDEQKALARAREIDLPVT